MIFRSLAADYPIFHVIPVPDGMAEIVAPLREMIMEAVAETDEALMVKPERYEKKEYVNKNELKQIVYEDEAVDERIKHNYTFVK